MEKNGFFRLSRQFRNWEWYSDPIVKSVFLELLLRARYEPGITQYRGVEIRRGEVVTGRKELAVSLGVSEQNIRTAIKKLKKTNEISTSKITNKFTVYLLNNYEKFNPIKKNQPANQPSSNHQLTTYKKERKEEIKENNKIKLPDWLDKSAWDGYLDIRRKYKMTMTDRVIKRLLKKLDEFNNAGYDTTTILDTAATSGWKDIYEPKFKPIRKRGLVL